jgi:hypothetical protein
MEITFDMLKLFHSTVLPRIQAYCGPRISLIPKASLHCDDLLGLAWGILRSLGFYS